MTRFIIILSIFYVAFAVYGYQAVKTISKNLYWQWGYLLAFAGVLVFLWFKMLSIDQSAPVRPQVAVAGGIFFAFFLLAFFLGVFLLVEDLVRLSVLGYNKIAGVSENAYLPSRRKFVSSIAMSLAAVPFSALLYGMIRGKYNYQVLKYQLTFDDLPASFDGYKLVQISDVHSGSFDNETKVSYGIDLINQQQGDVILFTGDLVNDRADEIENWKHLFSKLTAKDGVYSVLGNHDYGDYVQWSSQEAKQANLSKLIDIQRQMGFDVLLDEHRYLERNGDKIALLGVQNWGRGGFKKAGDLEKAKQGIDKNDFKILMSHDPSHWEDVVINDDFHFHLTLSGHTHGMQFGVEIPGLIKWSPVKWRYKYWAGVYKELGQYLNVNRGFGFIGYPGRVGILPEISVITLKRAIV